jgi:hypothetical protein
MAITLSGDGISSDAIASLAASKLTGQVPDANAPSGSVIQVISVTADSAQSTSSTSFVKFTPLSLSITPRATNSKILVMYNCFGIVTAAVRHLVTTVYRNSTNLGATHGFGNFYTDGGYTEHYASGSFLDSPSSTSALEYAVYVKVLDSSYGCTIGDNARRSVLTVMEIAG